MLAAVVQVDLHFFRIVTSATATEKLLAFLWFWMLLFWEYLSILTNNIWASAGLICRSLIVIRWLDAITLWLWQLFDTFYKDFFFYFHAFDLQISFGWGSISYGLKARVANFTTISLLLQSHIWPVVIFVRCINRHLVSRKSLGLCINRLLHAILIQVPLQPIFLDALPLNLKPISRHNHPGHAIVILAGWCRYSWIRLPLSDLIVLVVLRGRWDLLILAVH